jgi:hypothetical protein
MSTKGGHVRAADSLPWPVYFRSRLVYSHANSVNRCSFLQLATALSGFPPLGGRLFVLSKRLAGAPTDTEERAPF